MLHLPRGTGRRHVILLVTLALVVSGPAPRDIRAASSNVGCNANPATRATDLVASITAANSGGPSTVTLAAGCTYTLTAVDNTSATGPNGLPLITGDVTIAGNNAVIERSTAATTPKFRLLEVADGAAVALRLQQLTLRRGVSSSLEGTASGAGGGILVNGGVVTLTNTIVTGNSAGDNSSGGGLAVAGGTVTLTNSTVSSNSAGSAGGVLAFSGTVTLNNSTVINNSANTSGGGVVVFGGTATLTNTTVSGNTANAGGGGLNVTTGMLTLTDTTISGNMAANGPGGGLWVDAGTVAIRNTTISGNEAVVAGGVGISSGTMALTNSSISGNIARKTGGGLHMPVTVDEVADLVRDMITGTGPLSFAGAIFANLPAVGGGVFVAGGTVTLTNTTLSGNVAGSSGGGLFVSSGTATLTNTIVAGNTVEAGVNCGGNAVTNGGGNLQFPGADCGDNFISADPRLAALASNGGSTQTHALSRGSAAVATGNAAVCTAAPVNNLDQRGFTRPTGSCDSGAFDSGAAATADLAVIVTANPNPAPRGSEPTYTLTVTNLGPADATTMNIADLVPANTTFVSLNAPAGWTCATPAVGDVGTVSCGLPTLTTAAGPQVLTMVVRVRIARDEGDSVVNTAVVSSATTDPVAGNNTATTVVSTNLADATPTPPSPLPTRSPLPTPTPAPAAQPVR